MLRLIHLLYTGDRKIANKFISGSLHRVWDITYTMQEFYYLEVEIMRVKSGSKEINNIKNTGKGDKNIPGGTRNYVSGEPAPSSANHKFQNTQKNN